VLQKFRKQYKFWLTLEMSRGMGSRPPSLDEVKHGRISESYKPQEYSSLHSLNVKSLSTLAAFALCRVDSIESRLYRNVLPPHLLSHLLLPLLVLGKGMLVKKFFSKEDIVTTIGNTMGVLLVENVNDIHGPFYDFSASQPDMLLISATTCDWGDNIGDNIQLVRAGRDVFSRRHPDFRSGQVALAAARASDPPELQTHYSLLRHFSMFDEGRLNNQELIRPPLYKWWKCLQDSVTDAPSDFLCKLMDISWAPINESNNDSN